MAVFPETETETLTVKNVGRRQSTVVPPQIPRHCHVAVPPTRVPTEQPVALHAPFCAGEMVQLVLVALPQLPSVPHWNVAEPLRQEAVSDTVTVFRAAVGPTRDEQLPQLTLWLGQGGSRQTTVVPPQRPTHCQLVSLIGSASPAEQVFSALPHRPFTRDVTVQLALVALPQLPLLLHWNVADPVRQSTVFETVALVPAAVGPTSEEQPLPQLSVWRGQGAGGQPTVLPPQRPAHCHLVLSMRTRSPAEQVFSALPHWPFTGDETVQLALVALPQLPLLLHWNVAEPVRQATVFETVALVPAAAGPTPEEQPPPQLSVWRGQRGHTQSTDSVAGGLVD